MERLRKDLSAQGLLNIIRNEFEILAKKEKIKTQFTLSDCLMSGLAVFGLKFPSLLQFDSSKDERIVRHNLKSLYQVNRAPCDTYLRERLDPVDPADLLGAFKAVFNKVQRGKELEKFSYINNHYLLSVDGTGYFSSPEVHCENCCEKHHRNGKVTYYHQMLGAVLMHPDCREVLPFAPEPIHKQDGSNKNDCERNASKRLLTRLRKEHPHLKLIVTEDALASNAPHIKLLQSLEMRFILGVKPKDHQYLFQWVKRRGPKIHQYKDPDGVMHTFYYIENAPLNAANRTLAVNFVEYWETKPNGKEQHFSWVTDLPVNEFTLFRIMKGGRARWKIENETFNTLKNQGYQFEHNFGHGNKNLSTVFAFLMMLAFFVDQAQQLCCKQFQQAWAEAKSKTLLWFKLKSIFCHFLVDNWSDVYRAIIEKPPNRLIFDTS